MRYLFVLLPLALLAFSINGYFASFEPMEGTDAYWWRMLYRILTLVAVLATVYVVAWARRGGASKA